MNKDILALPENEQMAWLHGVISGMSVAYVKVDEDVSACLRNWAFETGNGLKVLPGYMELYPNEPAYSVVYAVAKQACPGI